MNLRQLDKKHFGRQGDPEDVIVGNSADSYVTEARGRKYIDFMMGWCGASTAQDAQPRPPEPDERIHADAT